MRIVGLSLALALLGGTALAGPIPASFNAPVRPLSEVDSITLPRIDRALVAREDAEAELVGDAPRYAILRKVDISPQKDGTWDRGAGTTRIWRYRVKTDDALSLNFAFTKFYLPQGASLMIYTPDYKETRGPFTDADNRSYRELWTPVLIGKEAVIEVVIAAHRIDELELNLTQIGQGYRGFGEFGQKSGACNMDVACLNGSDPWLDNSRAVAVISTGGGTFCSGSLINNAANDGKPYFITASHCGINAGNAASLVTYWNYQNSTCRTPGSTASGQAGDGSLALFNTGSTFRANYATSDVTLVELTTAPPTAANVFWAGWDRTPYTTPGGPGLGDFACSAGSLCAGIHHPSTDEKRITFVEENTTTTSYNNPAIPGNQSHVHAMWDPTPVFPPSPSTPIPPQVTEGGSSGSPLYNAQRRYIGQLHGGPSACGSTGGNLSDYYGRFSVSWNGGGTAATRVSDWLDPGATGAMTIDGRNQCTAPAIPSGVTASATAPNQITVSWTSTGADSYKVYRGSGACPGTNWQLIASNVTGTSYADNTVSGSVTYSYAVSSFSSGATCESAKSLCNATTATGICTLSPTFAGATGAASSGTPSCGLEVSWNAATSSCSATAPKYSVYRETTAGFTPNAGNRVASCLTTTTWHDGAVGNGTRYHYIVRAEDDTANGAGACNNGNEDANLTTRSAVPAGAPSVLLSDDIEGATTNWTVSGTGAVGANFSVVTTAAHTATHSWFAPDPANLSDRQLATATPLAIGSAASLEFWHRYNTETNGAATTLYDGIVLEYSLNGTTWVDILAANGAIPANTARFLAGGYVGPISSGFSSAIGGRQAWSGDNLAFTQVRVDLGDFAGQNVYFRWRMVTDSSTADAGYWVDDVLINVGSPCTSTNDLIFANGFQ